MSSRFKKATRQQAKLRLGLDGPSGSGKSYSALRFAFAFPDARVACVEAGENGGLLLFHGEAPDGIPFHFDHTEIRGNYSPMEYVQAIEDAGREGYDVLIIDSLSHAWAGAGGALDQVGMKGFTDKDGWRTVTPQHNRLIDAILQSPCHVIATLRSKTEYIIEEDEKGRKVPRKVGMAPIQRAGMEYEFTVYGSIDHSHTLTITKSRCSAMQDLIAHKPGAGFVRPLIQWLQTGEMVAPVEVAKRVGADQVTRIEKVLREAGATPSQVRKGLDKHGVTALAELTVTQADEYERIVTEWAEKKKLAAAAKVNGAAESPAATSAQKADQPKLPAPVTLANVQAVVSALEQKTQ